MNVVATRELVDIVTRKPIDKDKSLFQPVTTTVLQGTKDLFQPKMSTISTRALISVHFKTVRYFSQPIFRLLSY